jgi:hypothetical protein
MTLSFGLGSPGEARRESSWVSGTSSVEKMLDSGGTNCGSTRERWRMPLRYRIEDWSRQYLEERWRSACVVMGIWRARLTKREWREDLAKFRGLTHPALKCSQPTISRSIRMNNPPNIQGSAIPALSSINVLPCLSPGHPTVGARR